MFFFFFFFDRLHNDYTWEVDAAAAFEVGRVFVREMGPVRGCLGKYRGME
jgi:hypothetical protein